MQKPVLLFGFSILFGIWNLGVGISSTHAIYDPLTVPNNRIGIHILDPQEITQAADLVNSSGGQWGYVTVPIRSNDRDKLKWQIFFDKCRQLKLIPLIRLSTYPIGRVWEKPTSYDLVDFANFLSDLPWPTTNRYIILFNEPNHSYEWGGEVSSLEYVNLLLDAQRIFKNKSPDYFLLTAGLDMSVPTSPTSLDALVFYRQMFAYQPNWYSYIDGLSVHAYPNPGFVAPITSTSRYGVRSYRHELALISHFVKPTKPVFITETGTKLSSGFYPAVFTQVWTDQNIVAITPFLLSAASGEFSSFSFLDSNHQPKAIYYHVKHFPKIAGSPQLADRPFPVPHKVVTSTGSANFTQSPQNKIFSFLRRLIFKTTSQSFITIGTTTWTVDIADTDAARQTGLSNRPTLSANSGMVFLFPAPDIYSFWMQDMRFPLDFVWILDNKVVQLDAHIPPLLASTGPPQIITPSQPVNMVLELSAGQITVAGIQVGNQVNLQTNP